MATPILKSANIQSSQDDDFTITPSLRSASIQSPINEPDPIVTPVLRAADIHSPIDEQDPIVTPVLRAIEVDGAAIPVPPNVTLDSPSTGPLTGVVALEATVSDPNLSGLTGVEFLVNGTTVYTSTSAPHQYTYDTSAGSDGLTNFRARATSNSGLTTTTSDLYLMVDNSGPNVILPSPSSGFQAGVITLEAVADDPHTGISLVEFLVNSTVVGSTAISPYQVSFDTASIPDGPTDFQARATNGVGISSTSSTTSLITDNSPPNITLVNPVSGPLTGIILFEATASDSISGISTVEYYVDGNPIGSSAVSPYNVAFDTSVLGNGPHDFLAVATNGSGLTSSTTTYTLVTSNVGSGILPSIPLPECNDINSIKSDVALRAEYMYRVLTNFLRLLEDEDKEFIERYWGGLQQITEDYFLQIYQADLSKNIFTVPVFRRSRWNEIILTEGSHRAQLMSAITGEYFNTSVITGDNTLTLYFDGNPATITFTDSSANHISDVVSQINAQVKSAFPGLDVSVAYAVEGRIIIRSIDLGESAYVKISDADPNTRLGFYPGTIAYGSGISTRAEPAQILASSSAAIFDTSISSGNNELKVSINGENAKTVQFPDDSTTTIIAVRNAINTEFPGLATITNDNRILLTSDKTGDNSYLSIPSGGGNSEVGFSDGSFAIGRGIEIDDPIADRPISYELRVGTSDDNLNLIPMSDPAVVSIPALRSRIDGPLFVIGQSDSPHKGTEEIESNLGGGIDSNAEIEQDAYLIRGGRIHFSKPIESKVRNYCLGTLWAEDVYRNDTYLKDNFGFPIQVVRDNSIEYKNVLQGLHHSYWTGPVEKRTEVGLNLLFGLPAAQATGRIDQISILASPELIGTEASDVFDVRDSNRTFAFNIDGVFIFAIFDPTNSYPDSGPSVSHENYPASLVVADINSAALAAGLGFAPASLQTAITGVSQIKLSGVNSIRIDTITGNEAVGFAPGSISFGKNEIVIDGKTFEISTEFPITKNPGDVVEKFEPLTDGVEVLHYISDPMWWQVFGLASLDSSFSISNGYTKDDLRIINDILKYHVFGVKIVPDAFTRLGDIELGIVSKFINDIKGLTKNFILLIPFVLLDVFSVSDDPNLTGYPDTGKNVQLHFPHPTLNVSNWNQIGTNENAGINPSSTSYTNANSGITRENLVDGSFAGDTSGFELDNEVVYISNGGSIVVLDSSGSGSAPQRYIPASVTADMAGPYDTSGASGSFSLTINGFTTSIFFGSGSDQIPISPILTSGEVAESINAKLSGSYGSISGEVWAGITTDNKLKITVHRYDGVAPTINIGVAVPEIGFNSAPGMVLGEPGVQVYTSNF